MIKYSKGYKYQLEENYQVMTPVKGVCIVHDYFELDADGTLRVLKGYAWDGATGLLYTPKGMREPSMVHDVFCQSMRACWISFDKWQDTINEFFKQQCIERGVWSVFASACYAAVEFANAGDPAQGLDRPVLIA